MSQYFARHDSAPGALLAAAREELNLSVSDVARHLKLSPAQVEALEEGAYDRLPGRVFVRGFLRNYAKLLGIDPQPLLRTIDHEMPQPVAVEEAPPTHEVVMPREQQSKWPLYTGFAAMAIVGLLAVYEFGFNEPHGAAKDAEPETAAATPPPAPATEAAPPAAARTEAATPASPPAPATGSLSSTKPLPPLPPPGPASALSLQASRSPGELMPSTPAASDADAPKPGQRALHFKFDTESWVEIRDRNDKVIFSKLNHAGSEERVNGTPPFKLVVGNAKGVRLDIDDKPIDLAPHIGVTVARLTLP